MAHYVDLIRIFSIVCFGVVLLVSHSVRADCATVTMGPKPAGQIFYNADAKVLQYCDGTKWILMHRAGSGTGGCNTATMGLQPEGRFFYNADHRVMQVCAGNIRRVMGPVGGMGGGSWSNPESGLALNNPSPNATDQFGISVGVSGVTAVVGVVADEADGGTGISGAGRAYVFDRATGSLIGTLNNPSPNVDDGFGSSVAISGTTAVVGAEADESDGDAGVGGAGRLVSSMR